MTEPEDTTDDNVWGVIGDVLEDVMEQEVVITGSMIVFAVSVGLVIRYAPYLYQLAFAYITRNQKSGD